MKHHSSIFDQCQTRSAIHDQLQHFTRTLLAVIQNQNTSSSFPPDIALDVLSELSYADVKYHEDPVFVLSEICRLLFKSGDQVSFRRALTLAHILYAFKCRNHESWYISYLYKSIAQLGLRMTDLGIKNVLVGLSEQAHFTMMPEDRALGNWALMSASILRKNLSLAYTYAKTWHEVAQSTGLRGEIVRARIAICFIFFSGKPRTIVRILPAP